MQTLTPQILQQRFLDTIEDSYERGMAEKSLLERGVLPRGMHKEYMKFGLAELKRELRGENEKRADMVSAQNA